MFDQLFILFYKFLYGCNYNGEPNILEDKKVYNHYLYGLYKLHKEEKKITGGSVKTEKLFHATSTRNAMSIIQNNFDWGKTGRCRFGQGVCFSPYPNYANKYASSTGVLVGGIQEVGVNYDLKVPCDPEADTTVCYRNEVYVKYYDYEFYPIYVVEYKFNKN
ncbi:zinc finger CCCH-type antiviral protein 1-like [Adelges cooleyi]|uniref:zinc finger CCCH-type antiviral protein 1-like n=1 Tax=Adelges cooleyi TaxID=133065 RepID=UPI00218006B1|nr:zinc finger CCCH-type antiviral protein 1-like [Adelges cooleyi]